MIQLYSERMQIFLSEYMHVIILRCVVHKLYVAKNCLPPGLSQSCLITILKVTAITITITL